MLSVTGTPGSSSAGQRVPAASGTAPVRTFEVGHTSSGIRCSARCASSAGSVDAADAVADALGAQVRNADQIVAGPVVSPACGSAAQPRVPGGREGPANAARSTPASGAAQPEADGAVRAVRQRPVQGGPAASHAQLTGDVEDPAELDAVLGAAPAPGPRRAPRPARRRSIPAATWLTG